jgi:hypothetical protein
MPFRFNSLAFKTKFCSISESFCPLLMMEHWTSHSTIAERNMNKQTNSMVWVRERTILTERPPLVGEVIANFCG